MRKISIHALREEGDGSTSSGGGHSESDFNPRPPRGGRHRRRVLSKTQGYFNPRPPRGGRRTDTEILRKNDDFNPRPPRGGRPKHRRPKQHRKEFQSTPSARRATDGKASIAGAIAISIHALREEGDVLGFRIQDRPEISIHALREEGDDLLVVPKVSSLNFNPRPPRGGRRTSSWPYDAFIQISIHALREEGDEPKYHRRIVARFISIHALREEGDQLPPLVVSMAGYFNPRPPRGGRRCGRRSLSTPWKFQSTPSARRATRGATPVLTPHGYFNPRPPRGGRQQK